jgi:hypothetical protein
VTTRRHHFKDTNDTAIIGITQAAVKRCDCGTERVEWAEIVTTTSATRASIRKVERRAFRVAGGKWRDKAGACERFAGHWLSPSLPRPASHCAAIAAQGDAWAGWEQGDAWDEVGLLLAQHFDDVVAARGHPVGGGRVACRGLRVRGALDPNGVTREVFRFGRSSSRSQATMTTGSR